MPILGDGSVVFKNGTWYAILGDASVELPSITPHGQGYYSLTKDDTGNQLITQGGDLVSFADLFGETERLAIVPVHKPCLLPGMKQVSKEASGPLPIEDKIPGLNDPDSDEEACFEFDNFQKFKTINITKPS